MILEEQVHKSASLSECGHYRYSLIRSWGEGESLAFVMLNPSTADAEIDDPTVRRCIGFARREGYSRIIVLNLYAYRATDPKHLLTCQDPVGPFNDQYLSMVLAERMHLGLPVVAAWGANADNDPDRVAEVLGLVTGVDWRCFGYTMHGSPKHPLYIKNDEPLVPFHLGGTDD